MNATETHHRPGIHENSLVKREIKLDCKAGEKIPALQKSLDEMDGVDRVAINPDTGTLKIEYDATVLQLHQIRSRAKQFDCRFSNDWKTRAQTGWYAFVDKNILDKSKEEPHCCH